MLATPSFVSKPFSSFAKVLILRLSLSTWMSHMGRPYLLYCYFFFNMSKIIGIYKCLRGCLPLRTALFRLASLDLFGLMISKQYGKRSALFTSYDPSPQNRLVLDTCLDVFFWKMLLTLACSRRLWETLLAPKSSRHLVSVVEKRKI